MNLAQRTVLCLSALVLLWLSICTPRTFSERVRGQDYTYQEGHHYFWEQNWAVYAIDYTRLAFELVGVVLVCFSLVFALKSQRVIPAR